MKSSDKTSDSYCVVCLHTELFFLAQNEHHNQCHVRQVGVSLFSMVQGFQKWNNLEDKNADEI